jgi:hypothetical protein
LEKLDWEIKKCNWKIKNGTENGIGMELEWNRNGIGMESEWNRNGIGMESEWNRNLIGI